MKKKYYVYLAIAIIFSLIFENNNKKFKSQSIPETATGFKLECPAPPNFSESIQPGNIHIADASDIDQNWYQGVMENIQQEEYNITYSDELDEFQSPNRANNIRFIYHKDGFTAKTRTNKIPKFDLNDKTIKQEDKEYETIDEWSVRFKIKNKEFGIENGKLAAAGNKANIENENVRIEYTNDEDGMRQDFIVKQKFSFEKKLQLNFDVSTKLKMIVTEDELSFRDKNGEDKMTYSSLKCWDANGKELSGYFESQNLTGKQFSICVNDEDAVYPVTIDPVSSTPIWTKEIDQPGANFGFSVSTAGDINGDGYSDVIIGAQKFDNGQTDEGRAYVYQGSPAGLLQTASWMAESNQEFAFFGWSVSSAGDVNGDGCSEVIVGAAFYTNGQTEEGKAFLYYGSLSGLSMTAGWVNEGNRPLANFGWSVSSAGDVNGDGFSDVIVGAENYNLPQTISQGKVFVYHGSPSGLSDSVNWTANIGLSSGFFGYSVSTAGDVNGDGFSDVIIGAYRWQSNPQVTPDEGKSFLYYGSLSGLSATAGWTAEGNQTAAYFGCSVSTAGDINGDNYSDVIIGANRWDNYHGKVFVYLGSSSGLALSAAWTAIGDTIENLGIRVSTAGDANGDGYSDIIIGAYSYSNGQFSEGRAYVYHGSEDGFSDTPDWKAESNQANAFFGWSVSSAGDVNGDGFSDVIIGAINYTNGQTDEGRVYVYKGTSSGLLTTPCWAQQIDQPDAGFGQSVSTAGDINVDGFSDVIIGAPGYDNGLLDAGRVFVYYGSEKGLSGSPAWFADGDVSSDDFGYSVAAAGDINKDNYPDIIIGAPHYGFGNQGRAFIYYGSSAGLPASPSLIIASTDGSWFGSCVSSAGDVNGDTYSDIIIGAPFLIHGAVYVHYGSHTGLSPTPNWSKVNMNNNQDLYGSSVSTAGDVNHDGFSDIIVGADEYEQGGIKVGAAYVYYGSGSGLSNVNWTVIGNQDIRGVGQSVSTAGDVNHDGCSDVIIGAFDYGGSQLTGRALVYHGSPSGLSPNLSWSSAGSQLDDHYGIVSTAGDVNGDGYSDVIIGAQKFSNGQMFEGAAYVFHGSQSGLSQSADWIVEGNQDGIYFGRSVSTAGDVNGDGYSDVIIGATVYVSGGSGNGYAFVYCGNSGIHPETKSLNLDVLIQGFYNPLTNLQVEDTVRVYLRKASPPYEYSDSAKLKLTVFGSGVFFYNHALENILYYLHVKHRNSIETWSKTTQTFNALSLAYDFTPSANKAYGDNMIQVDVSPIEFAMYGGDVNQDGTVDITDSELIDNDIYDYEAGYVATDLNGDNFVDTSDGAIVDNNVRNYVSVIRP